MNQTKTKKQTIMLKLSGASLKDGDVDGPISFEILQHLAEQVKLLTPYYNIAIVLGGGNIWRGKIVEKINMERYQADYMGMLATVINSIALESVFKNNGIKTKVYSKLEITKVCDDYLIRNVLKDLENGVVTILAGGTGSPFFTTDTGSAIAAIEIKADAILMGKNDVDGVYSDDPKLNPNATFYPTLTYDDLFVKDLKVMDAAAISLCKEYKISLIVFKINEKWSIIKTLKKENKFTLIS